MKIAVVGSGVSGLGAVWVNTRLRVFPSVILNILMWSLTCNNFGLDLVQALNEYSDHEVHLFEADDRPGGHANTVEYTSKATGLTTAVDT